MVEALLVLALAATGCSGSTVNESEPAGGEPEAQADATHLSPEPRPAEGPFTAMATGSGHACAIRANGTIVCWGDNRYGQSEALKGRFIAIASGGNHNCAIRVEGTIACWGEDEHGTLDAPEGEYGRYRPGTGTVAHCGPTATSNAGAAGMLTR